MMDPAALVGWGLHRLRFPLGAWAARLDAYRRARAAGAEARVLLRVDDYPHWSVPTARFRTFHKIMTAADVPFLLAATPFLAADPLSPVSHARPQDDSEWEWLAGAVASREVEVGLHGATHRTRQGGFHSEFDGVPLEETRAVIAEAWVALGRRGCPPVAFVPPFDRFPPALWPALPAECRILCLGPESLRDVPATPTVGTRNGRIVVFSLPPFYGRASDILAALENGRWLERPGVVLPITLHWTWELEDDFAAVAALARRIAPLARPWRSLTAAAARAVPPA